jgi:hypothetical protein
VLDTVSGHHGWLSKSELSRTRANAGTNEFDGTGADLVLFTTDNDKVIDPDVARAGLNWEIEVLYSKTNFSPPRGLSVLISKNRQRSFTHCQTSLVASSVEADLL